MPYVDPAVRDKLTPTSEADALAPGELNYQLTRLMLRYLENGGLNYTTINDILGAAEGAKQEFYRRVAAPYENHKIDLNGDVYP